MRSKVTLSVTLDHDEDLPFDAQGIADAVSRLLTDEVAGDPLASAHALLLGATISHRPTHANDPWHTPYSHPAVTLVGGDIPAHVPGAYPNLSCCGGPVQLVAAR